MLILFYLLFSIFEIFSSGYDYDFKKVDKIPSEITCYNYTNVYDSNQHENSSVLSSLKFHFRDFVHSNYCVDMKHSTGVCLETGSSNYYNIAFSDGGKACSPVQYMNKKPLAIGVSKNIIVYLTLEGDFYMSKVPESVDKYTKEKSYMSNVAQKAEHINFDLKTNDIIKNEFHLYDENATVYCFPGNEGEFYFTFDPVNKTKLYLLTIKKSISVPSEVKKPVEPEVKKPDESKRFFTPTKILLCSGFAIGIFLFIFRNFIKIKLLNNF